MRAFWSHSRWASSSRGKREGGWGNEEGERRGNRKEECYKAERRVLEGASANSPVELLTLQEMYSKQHPQAPEARLRGLSFSPVFVWALLTSFLHKKITMEENQIDFRENQQCSVSRDQTAGKEDEEKASTSQWWYACELSYCPVCTSG